MVLWFWGVFVGCGVVGGGGGGVVGGGGVGVGGGGGVEGVIAYKYIQSCAYQYMLQKLHNWYLSLPATNYFIMNTVQHSHSWQWLGQIYSNDFSLYILWVWN